MLRRRVRHRAGERGAAMVEGVVVISTMLVFFGLIVFTRNSYAEKLDIQQGTRSDVLYYASHACEGGRPNVTTGSESEDVGGEGGAKAEGVGSRTSEPGAAALGRSWNTASSSRDSRVNGVMTVDRNATGGGGAIQLQRAPISRSVHAESTVACNEKRYDNPWTAWVKYGVDWAKSGGGIL